MSCLKKRTKKKIKKLERKKVYPLPFSLNEQILCNGCEEYFPLTDIKINCAGCSLFYHCKIAGTCKGSACNIRTDIGDPHKLSWCINCVPKIKMNCEKQSREESCLCQDCLFSLSP